MSEEPINSKSTARSLHRASKHLDKNTSGRKYKKQDADEKKKARQELEAKEQDPEGSRSSKRSDDSKYARSIGCLC
eukprot:gene5258-6086_t